MWLHSSKNSHFETPPNFFNPSQSINIINTYLILLPIILVSKAFGFLRACVTWRESSSDIYWGQRSSCCRFNLLHKVHHDLVRVQNGAVHKRRHQSRGRGFAKRWSYLIRLFSKSDDDGGGGSKSQKIDDVIHERPQFGNYPLTIFSPFSDHGILS